MSRSDQSSCALKSPVSARKAEANRRNALRSTGPKSDEGKARASRNAVSHGIFSNAALPGENQDHFDALRRDLIAEHKPQTPTELFLVERMANSMWRLGRVNDAVRASHDSYNDYLVKRCDKRPSDLKPPPATMAAILDHSWKHTSVLEKLQQYEQRLEGTFHRALRQMQKLRTPAKGQTAPQEPSPYLPPGQDGAADESDATETLLEQEVAAHDENVQNEATGPSHTIESASKIDAEPSPRPSPGVPGEGERRFTAVRGNEKLGALRL